MEIDVFIGWENIPHFHFYWTNKSKNEIDSSELRIDNANLSILLSFRTLNATNWNALFAMDILQNFQLIFLYNFI